MRERDEFIQLINTFKTVSTSITDVQRHGLLKQAVQNYGLSVEEGTEILKSLGLVVGEDINYFEVLGLSMEEIQGLDEQTIVSIVEEPHEQHYKASLRAGGRPRADGRTEEQWRTLLNQARDTLIDPHKRREYVAILQNDQVNIIFEGEASPTFELSNVEETTRQELSHQTTPDDVDVPDNMVFVPAGEFQMGSRREEENDSEMTVHTVHVNAFFMDRYSVTNAQYKMFLDTNPQWQKKKIPEIYHDGNYLQNWGGNNYPKGKADYPVVDVSWYAAMAYAQWIEKRLPTEAEWEKAARGGLTGQRYPWGDQIDMSMANYDMHIGRTTPVGKYPPNDYGVYDVVGNVWEWCLDEYDHSSQRRNPGLIVDSINEITTNFLSVKTSRVVRGGSWASSERAAQVAYCGVAAPIVTYYSYGFRCVKAVDT